MGPSLTSWEKETFQGYLNGDSFSEVLKNTFHRRLIVGFVIGLIFCAAYYNEGSIGFFGPFSAISAIQLLSVVGLGMFVTSYLANFIGAVVLYLVLSTDVDLGFETFFVACIIGGNVSRNFKADMLLEEYIGTDSGKTTGAIITSAVIFYLLIGFAGLMIYLEMGYVPSTPIPY
jgi:hypothetical protein